VPARRAAPPASPLLLYSQAVAPTPFSQRYVAAHAEDGKLEAQLRSCVQYHRAGRTEDAIAGFKYVQKAALDLKKRAPEARTLAGALDGGFDLPGWLACWPRLLPFAGLPG